MNSITEYLDTPITIREVVQSKSVWLTVFCGFLLYKLYKKSETKIDTNVQSQQGGKGNTQNLTKSEQFMSNNQVLAAPHVVNRNSKIGAQHNVLGESNYIVYDGDITVS